MGTPRNLETQNSHPIQDASSAEKAGWFLQQQSEAPKEEQGNAAGAGRGQGAFFPISSFQPRQKERRCLQQRQNGKGCFFFFFFSSYSRGWGKLRGGFWFPEMTVGGPGSRDTRVFSVFLRREDPRPFFSPTPGHGVIHSCLTLCDPMDYSPSGSSAHGILQARILEWVAILFSRGIFSTQWLNPGLCIAGRFFTIWATREAHMQKNEVVHLPYTIHKNNSNLIKDLDAKPKL